MREPIPYVTRERDSAALWLDRLRAAMPDERVVPFDDLTANERASVRVAVVADPDPTDLAALPALEWVQSTWAGVETMAAELPHRIGIARLVDPALADTMAEAVLTAVLWLHRGGPHYAAAQAARRWDRLDYVPAGERSVAILGLGTLGTRAAGPLVAHGFAVTGWSRTAKDVPGVAAHAGPDALSRVLGAADIAVSLLPLTPDTAGLIGTEALAAMRPGAAFVNFGRGGTVDEPALLAALDRGHLAHALLDVFAVEPLPADHLFWTHERITVWPHVSAPTDPASASRIVADAIARWRRTGTPPPLIDRRRGY